MAWSLKKKKPVEAEKPQPTETIETNAPIQEQKVLTPEQERLKHVLEKLGGFQGVIDYDALMNMPSWMLTAQNHQFLIALFAETHFNGVMLKNIEEKLSRLVEIAEKP